MSTRADYPQGISTYNSKKTKKSTYKGLGKKVKVGRIK